jgi:threonine dehydratase
VHRHVSAQAHRTPVLTSLTLSEATSFDVLLKAELVPAIDLDQLRGLTWN